MINPHQILYFFDDGFAECTFVSAYSVLQLASRPIKITLAYSELSQHSKELAERFTQKYPLQTELLPLQLDLPDVQGSHISSAALGRLKAFDRFSERVLYLDGDTIALKDVTPLFELDLHGAPIAAALCPTHLSWWYKSRHKSRIGYKRNLAVTNHRLEALNRTELSNCINSGVLLVDPDQVRKLGLMSQFSDIERAAQLRWHDQDLINLVFEDNIRILDSRYNSIWGNVAMSNRAFPRSLREASKTSRSDPVILHYAGKQKPWKPERWKPLARVKDHLFRRKQLSFRRQFWTLTDSLEAEIGLELFKGVDRSTGIRALQRTGAS